MNNEEGNKFDSNMEHVKIQTTKIVMQSMLKYDLDLNV